MNKLHEEVADVRTDIGDILEIQIRSYDQREQRFEELETEHRSNVQAHHHDAHWPMRSPD